MNWRRAIGTQWAFELGGIAVRLLFALHVEQHAPRRARPMRRVGDVREVALRRQLAICMLSCMVLLATTGGEGPLWSRWSTPAAASMPVLPTPIDAPHQASDHPLTGPPSLTAAQVDAVLATYGSPAAGSGQVFYDQGLRHNIDPAYALAFFIHESSAGTAPNWAGNKDDGTTTHNVGNIICANYATCYGRFRDYPDWETGIADWYRLIADEYVEWRGLSTLEAIVPVYAPSDDNNDPQGYIRSVALMVESWRAQPN